MDATLKVPFSRAKRVWIGVAVCTVLLGAAWYGGAQQRAQQGAQQSAMHPAEFGLRAYCGPITKRIVVRDGPAKTDIWLFSGTSFDQLADRLRQAISSRRTLPGGVTIASWTYIEPNHSYWLKLGGSTKGRVHMSRHLKGTLLVLRGIGDPKQAQTWTPPYRPLPINMPHGPVR